MRLRKTLCFLLSCTLVVGCMIASTEAVDTAVERTETVLASPRATKNITISVAANSISAVTDQLSLSKGDKVTISLEYTPTSTDVDVGILDKDGNFTYVSGSNGSASGKITAPQAGNYYFAMRNNSSTKISATGTIKY